MPELRKDPIVGRWVIIAHERAKRPHDFKGEAQAPGRARALPVLRGAGGQDAARDRRLSRPRHAGPTGPGWRIRVVPNKFPALKIEGNLNKRGDGIYDMMAGIGAHEVIIESPRHHISMAALAEDNIREVLWVYRDRLVDLKKDTRLVHGMLFKNVGAAGGASLEHTHSQLIVTPIVPISVWEEMTGALEFFNYRGRCIYCDMVQQELATEKRIVLDTTHFTAFCPYASRFPFETWIVPKAHSSHFENIPKPGVDDLGSVLRQVLNKLELALDNPSYNYIIHTAPVRPPGAAALPLAHRGHPPADQGRRASSGVRASTSTRSPPSTRRLPPRGRGRDRRPVCRRSSGAEPAACAASSRRSEASMKRRSETARSALPVRHRRSDADARLARARVGPRFTCRRRRSMLRTRSRSCPPSRLILALHNHQPVGNFDGVFEAAYRDSYLPFLDVLEGLPRDPVRPAHLGPAAGMAGRAAARLRRAGPRRWSRRAGSRSSAAGSTSRS